MRFVAEFSHKGGKDFILSHHAAEFEEIKQVIAQVDAEKCKVKVSKEKTMTGRMLYSPIKLNEEYTRLLTAFGWPKHKLRMETTIPELGMKHIGFREMDFVKNKLGLEVQFGKYAFMVYNILAKMTIFARQDIIDSGVEIVAMRQFSRVMSTGVSYFEQVKSDLEYRGISDIDVPVLVLGVDTTRSPAPIPSTNPGGEGFVPPFRRNPCDLLASGWGMNWLAQWTFPQSALESRKHALVGDVGICPLLVDSYRFAVVQDGCDHG